MNCTLQVRRTFFTWFKSIECERLMDEQTTKNGPLITDGASPHSFGPAALSPITISIAMLFCGATPNLLQTSPSACQNGRRSMSMSIAENDLLSHRFTGLGRSSALACREISANTSAGLAPFMCSVIRDAP